MPTLRYTGARTGRGLATRYGYVEPGETIEVPQGIADAWTQEHPMAGTEPRDPESFSKDELVALAESHGVDITDAKTKADIAARLDEVAPHQKIGSDWELVSEAPSDAKIEKAEKAEKAPATTTTVVPPASEASPADTGKEAAPAGSGGEVV